MLKILLPLAFLFSLPPAELGSVDKEGLKRLLDPQSDSVYVLNFWATWCKPCLEEMPAFTALAADSQFSQVRLILLSLDSRKMMPDSSMLAFLKRKNIPAGLVNYLEAGDPNLWMGEVDRSWDGAIPATIILKKGEKPVFINESITAEALRNNVRQFYRK